MKASFLSILALAFALSCGAAPKSWPTQDEAQATFDGALSVADKVVISHIVGADETLPPLLTIESEDEIRGLVRYFRFVIVDKPEVIDGQLEAVHRSISCGCYGQFQMDVMKGSERLLRVLLAHGKLIACAEVHPESMILLDEASHAPFYERLIDLLPQNNIQRKIWEREKKKANQALQTTSVTRNGFGKVSDSDRQRRGV